MFVKQNKEEAVYYKYLQKDHQNINSAYLQWKVYGTFLFFLLPILYFPDFL